MESTTKSKYLTIQEVTVSGRTKKTRDFQVLNNHTGDFLGWINWYAPFRKYAFTPQGNCVFDPACLDHISTYCKNLMTEHKTKQHEKN